MPKNPEAILYDLINRTNKSFLKRQPTLGKVICGASSGQELPEDTHILKIFVNGAYIIASLKPGYVHNTMKANDYVVVEHVSDQKIHWYPLSPTKGTLSGVASSTSTTPRRNISGNGSLYQGSTWTSYFESQIPVGGLDIVCSANCNEFGGVESDILFACMGDSITNFSGGYVDILNGTKIGDYTLSTLKIAEDGITIDNLHKNYIKTMCSANPEFVSVLIGINNHGNTSPVIIEKLTELYLAIKQTCKNSKGEPSQLISLTLTPINNTWTTFQNNYQEITTKIKEINRWILENPIADYKIDIFSPFVDERGYLKNEFSSDGLHMNLSAHKIIFNILMNNVFSKTSNNDCQERWNIQQTWGYPMGIVKSQSQPWINNHTYDNSFRKYARQYQIDPHFVKAVAIIESGLNTNAKNIWAGGLMQIIPPTWNNLMTKLNRADKKIDYTKLDKGYKINGNDHRLSESDLNIHAGILYLLDMFSYCNNRIDYVVMLYNGGPGFANTYHTRTEDFTLNLSQVIKNGNSFHKDKYNDHIAYGVGAVCIFRQLKQGGGIEGLTSDDFRWDSDGNPAGTY